jgi:tRNA-dihydrouridine synthase 3
MCRAFEQGTCDHDPCKFSHDWLAYFAAKPADLPLVEGYVTEEPFVKYVPADLAGGDEDPVGRSIDLRTTCPVYRDLGYCPYGWKCRFLGGHVRRKQADVDGKTKQVGGWELPFDTPKEAAEGWKNGETNWPDQAVMNELRRAKVSWVMPAVADLG